MDRNKEDINNMSPLPYSDRNGMNQCLSTFHARYLFSRQFLCRQRNGGGTKQPILHELHEIVLFMKLPVSKKSLSVHLKLLIDTLVIVNL